MHCTEDVNERRVSYFALKRFECHFQLTAGNSGYPERACLAALVLTAMAYRFVVGGKHRNGTAWFYSLQHAVLWRRG